MRPLVVIPARGGSKGIPGKNIKELGGKPLIYYTIEAAREVFSDQHIIVSTDDEKIKKLVEQTGLKVPFLRPAKLATDEANTQDVLEHAITYVNAEGYQPEVVILLQPTSPFRTGQHIKGALELFNNDLDMVVSVKETDANPYYVLFEEDKDGFLKKSKEGQFTRRQDVPQVWELNGAIYIISINSLFKNRINEFGKVRKYEMDGMSSLDIDNNIDWLIAEQLCKL